MHGSRRSSCVNHLIGAADEIAGTNPVESIPASHDHTVGRPPASEIVGWCEVWRRASFADLAGALH